ncbi:MAG: undecaprenyl-phosphate glucose phosphotransferase [Filomicrobium sp.]
MTDIESDKIQAELENGSGRQRTLTANVISEVYPFIEFAILFCSGLLVAEIYVGGILGHTTYFQHYIWPITVTSLLTRTVLTLGKAYQLRTLIRFFDGAERAVVGIAVAFTITVLIALFLGNTGDFSRVWFVSWFAVSVASIWTARAFASHYVTRSLSLDAERQRLVLVGDADGLERLRTQIGVSNLQDLVLHSFDVALPGGKDASDADIFKTTLEYLKSSPADTIIIAPSPNSDLSINAAVDQFEHLPVRVKLFLDLGLQDIPLQGIDKLGNAHVVELSKPPLTEWERALKRAFDVTISAIALILLSPLLTLVAAAIRWESPGPAIYRQQRHGRDNEPFTVFKFRSMTVTESTGDFKQATRNDARVTRLGSFLRKSSIDELPQLANVLLGDMSIVGPRPHPIALNDKFSALIPRYDSRHRVKPGITGWAQIKGHRGPTPHVADMQKRVDADLYYIQNWSFWFDIKIIASTPFVALLQRNAI